MVRSSFTRLAALMVALACSAVAPAPINDPNPPAKPLLPVLSDQERERQQAEQRTFAEVGAVPQDTERTPVDAPRSDPGAAASVVAASQEVPRDGGSQKGSRGSVQGLPWIVLGLAGLLALAAKAWLDRRIPVPEAVSRRPPVL